MEKQQAQTGQPKPWWLVEDESGEPCEFCYHRLAYEVQYWCAGCDRRACAECVVEVRETEEVFCRECFGSDLQKRT